MHIRTFVPFILTATLVVGLTTVSTGTAEAAYIYKFCGNTMKWSSESITLRAGDGSFPAEHSRRDALQTAVDRWNEAPSDFVFGNPVFGDTSVGRKNNQNEIWFSEDDDVLDGAPGRAHLRFRCSGMREADITFDNREKWSYSTVKSTKTSYAGDFRPWGTGALHEMGHALGLAHENRRYNIMGSDAKHIHANGDTVRPYPGEDAANGAVSLYGTAGGNDLGVSHWKYGGVDGEYSTHKFVRIELGDQIVPDPLFEGVRRYNVFDNLDYKVEFTYENNGIDTLTNVDVGFYISTNDKITTKDQRIGTRVFDTISRGAPATLKHTVHIPELTVGQTYWLGVIIDYTALIGEFSEANNATYIPIRVVCCD